MQRHIEKGIRISQENFDDYEKIITIPIYAVNNIFNEPNSLYSPELSGSF
jgi:hypothetical protein